MCEGLAGGSCAHGLLQALLVDGHLDGDVRQAVVKLGVGLGCDGGVVARVLVELGDGADAVIMSVLGACSITRSGLQVRDDGDDLE